MTSSLFRPFSTILLLVLGLSLTGCGNEDKPLASERDQSDPNSVEATATVGENAQDGTGKVLVVEEDQPDIPKNQISELWGVDGELWTPQSRLPDFSMAGYRGGEPIPELPVAANVKDFGAVGDGKTDDTEAIQKAIDSVQEGAVLLPEGRYKITNSLKIEKSNTVLRGEGPDKTEFWIPKSLLEIEGGEAYEEMGKKKTKYAFGSAFVEIHGREPAPPLTEVVGEAMRGDREIVVADASTIQPGNRVRLWMKSHPDLGSHLHNGVGNLGSGIFGRGKKYYVDWVAGVESVNGNTLTLDRPLRTDVRLEWEPKLTSYVPTVSGSGVEGITFRFAGREKLPHLMEEGFNAVELKNVADCWARDLRIIDADLAVGVFYSRFCTVSNIEVLADKRKGITEFEWDGITGHHGLWVAGFSQDNLVENFTFKTKYHHDLTVENFANGNVFRNGKGLAVNFDHHSLAPYENLFTNIEVGDVSRIWLSSGRRDRLPHTAARTTVWNIRYTSGTFNYRFDRNQPYPPEWPQLNVVGLAGLPEMTDPDAQTWIEPLPDGVLPADLYEAQRTRN